MIAPACLASLGFSTTTAAQTPPSAPTNAAPAPPLARAMAPGWNLGNSLEAIGSGPVPAISSRETAWGNPPVTQAMMNAVRAAGFRSVRIPVAWAQYADAKDLISPFWLRRVEEVVGYARKADLYVVLNVHWDGGWLQPTYAGQRAANRRLAAFWAQIAERFRDYDHHLLFAGTNEITVTDVFTAPTAENCAVQNGFNQIFVNAVRETGGNNAARYLVVQGYNTNIDYTVTCNASLPRDTASGRLMMEVHYYDPYNFTLNPKSRVWQWGAGATDRSATENWGNEAHVDAQFRKVKTAFVDKGVPVILGEYAASLRSEHDPGGIWRTRWDRYVTRAAIQHGLVPMYWDNGYTRNHQFGLFDRGAATQAFPKTISEIVDAAR